MQQAEKKESAPNGLKWDYTPEEIKSVAQQAIKMHQEVTNQIIQLKGPRTFENTIVPLAKAEYEYASLVTPMLFLKSVSPHKELRDAALAADKELDAYDIKESINEEMFKVLKDYKEQAIKSKEWDSLTKEDQRFVDKSIMDFKLNGIELPADKKQKLQQLKNEIGELERTADKNINDDKSKVEIEEKMLKGLSQTAISKLEKSRDGYRFVSMKKPDIMPALKLVQDEETRKKLSFAYNNRASANTPIIEKIIQLRHEYALLLGYNSYSQYTLERKMAKTPETVQTFEEDLANLIINKGREELKVLTQLKRDMTGDQNATMNTWDSSFYQNQFIKKHYQLDSEKIREYFPVDQVKE